MTTIKKIIQYEIKQALNELKLQDLIQQIGNQRSSNFYHHKDHVDFMQNETQVFPIFQEFKSGILHFTHESSQEWTETAEETYDQYIKFYEWKNMVNMAQQGKTPKEITDVLYGGDLGVYCSCYSFWYHYSYAASQKKADVVLQRIPSPITNPGLVGIGCKHLDAILNPSTIKFNYNIVKNEISKSTKKVAKSAANKILHNQTQPENDQPEEQSDQNDIENI